MSSISGLRRFSVYNPATGTVVQCNNIRGEGEFYSRPIEDVNPTPTGGEAYGGDESFVEMISYDLDGFAQLESWMKSETKVSLVAAGYQENILWHETDRVRVEKRTFTRAGRRNYLRIWMERRGHGSHDIHSFTNLLQLLGWEDDDADGLADGYVNVDIETVSFANRVQTLDNSADAGEFRTDVAFPIEGVRFMLSADYTLSSGSPDLTLSFRDYGDSQLQAATTAIGGGRENASARSPANVYTLRAILATEASAFNVDVEDPALRVDNSDQYAAY